MLNTSLASNTASLVSSITVGRIKIQPDIDDQLSYPTATNLGFLLSNSENCYGCS